MAEMARKMLVSLMFAMVLAACVGPSPTPLPQISTPLASPTYPPLPETLQIALILPTAGLVAEAGLAAQQGALLAVEQRNDVGGVLDLPIEAVYFNSRSTAEGGRQAIGEARERGLAFLVGGLCASEAVVMSERVGDQTVFLSLNAHPRVGVDEGGTHTQGVYVMPLPDVLQAQAMARYARQSLHAQTAATLHDERSSLGTNLTQAFSETFVKDGGEIAEATVYSGLVKDYAAQLAPIATASPDVLFLPNCAPEVNVAAAQARQMGIDGALLGCDSWRYGLDEQAARDGYYCTEFTLLDPQVQGFAGAYSARFDSEADVFAALGYEAVQVLLDAVQAAESTRAGDVQHALHSLTFGGLTGPISFDQAGRARKNLALVRVEGGEQRFVAYVSP